jgi:GTPase SAR1 family protein
LFAPEKFNILTVRFQILGQSGVGKSTWINSIAHYLTYENLEDALDNDPVYLVPSSFTIYDENYQARRITVGEETEEEQFGVGKSATRAPKVHKFDFKGE